jgi:hypothetical protein
LRSACIILNSRIVWDVHATKSKCSDWFYFDVDQVKQVEDDVNNVLKSHSSRKSYRNVLIDVYVELMKKEGIQKILLERWHLESISKEVRKHKIQNHGIVREVSLAEAYRKTIVLVRSLYAYLILMPGYKLYRKTKQNRQTGTTIKYVMYVGEADPESFEDNSAGAFRFDAIDVESLSTIQLSVKYRKNIDNIMNVKLGVPTVQEMIIANYFEENINIDTHQLDTSITEEVFSKSIENCSTESQDEDYHVDVIYESDPFNGTPAFADPSYAVDSVTISEQYKLAEEHESDYRLDFAPPKESPLHPYNPPSVSGDHSGSNIGLIHVFGVPTILIRQQPEINSPNLDQNLVEVLQNREFTPSFLLENDPLDRQGSMTRSIDTNTLDGDAHSEEASCTMPFIEQEKSITNDSLVSFMVTLRHAPKHLNSTLNRLRQIDTYLEELEHLRMHRKEMMIIGTAD